MFTAVAFSGDVETTTEVDGESQAAEHCAPRMSAEHIFFRRHGALQSTKDREETLRSTSSNGTPRKFPRKPASAVACCRAYIGQWFSATRPQRFCNTMRLEMCLQKGGEACSCKVCRRFVPAFDRTHPVFSSRDMFSCRFRQGSWNSKCPIAAVEVHLRILEHWLQSSHPGSEHRS